jgi:para-aminobenzoate synthetase component 1
LKEFKQHKLRFNPFLENLYQSDKPLIIYKVEGGYDLFTDFSQKIIINNKNVEKFLNSFKKKKYKKETDIFIGFFGYEILCNLLNIKIKNQKKINFYKGVFYKPETIIKIRDNIKIYSTKKSYNFN